MLAHVEYNPSLIDELRRRTIRHVMDINTVRKSWPTWKKLIKKHLGKSPNADTLLDLGDHLSEIFTSTTKSGRSQQTVSGAGAAWEGLVCWYCNLCLMGSRTVVIKYKKSLVPDPIQKAITVSYAAVQTTSEADLIAITFPDIAAYKDELFDRYMSDKGIMARIDKLAQQTFKDHEVCIIQCKTNWNDSAQIPMLWNMVYNVKNFNDTSIRIGASGFSISDLKKFSYAFVTVPTNDHQTYRAENVNVQRVGILTGGNYWGHQSRSGVAKSIKEIFNTNFSGGCNRGLREDLNNALVSMATKYKYFNLT